MPYCEECGHPFKPGKKYCKNCGESLDPAVSFSPSVSNSINDDPDIQRYNKVRSYKRNIESSNESFQLFIGCIGIIATLNGVNLMAGNATKSMLDGNVGVLLTGTALLAILFKLLFDRMTGYSIRRSLVETVLIGGISYLLIYGVFWYFQTNFIATGQPLFTFSTPVIATPTR